MPSVSPTGAPEDAKSFDHPEMTADGRWVVFGSKATNLSSSRTQCDPAGLREFDSRFDVDYDA